MFRIIVPPDETYSFDMSIGLDTIPDTNREEFLEKNMIQALSIFMEKPSITQSELKYRLQISITSVKRVMKALRENGKIERMGSSRKGYWKITE